MGSRLAQTCAAAFVALASAGPTVHTQQASTPAGSVVDYIVGAEDVLAITSYDQADLSGRFAVEADGTFSYPLIGRLEAGGLTLRALELQVKKRLVDGGFFKNPQITVAVETYNSQKVFVVGEVRNPGTYTLSGNTNLIEALARAGSTLPTASGQAVIVRAARNASAAVPPTPDDEPNVERVNIRDLENGILSANTLLRDGDTIVVPRAESIYVFGQVKNPGAYVMQQQNSTTVLQALSLAGGVADRGATARIRIIRVVNSEKREIRVKLTDFVQPGDSIVVPERFF
jgi:polysaccharide export outer membrane protein